MITHYLCCIVYVVIFSSNTEAIVTSMKEFAYVYLDTSTMITTLVTPDNIRYKNGIFIGVDKNGESSTVCASYLEAQAVAKEACRLLNYTTDLKIISALALGVRPKATYPIPTRYVASCSASGDCSLKPVTSADYTCQNHVQDIHVLCQGLYTRSNIGACGSTDPCMVSRNSRNYVQIRSRFLNDVLYVCNRGSLGINEAQVLCRELGNDLTKNYPNARFIGVTGGSNTGDGAVGGFVELKCGALGGLSKCSGLFPYRREGCTPTNSAAVDCDPIPAVDVIPPNVTCNSSEVAVFWSSTKLIPIEIVTANPSICPESSISRKISGNLFIISMPLTQCIYNKLTGPTYLHYNYKVIRSFDVSENIITRENETFIVTCLLHRNSSANEGPLSVAGGVINPGEGTIDPSIRISLYSDQTLSNLIKSPGSVAIGSPIYATIDAINPTPKAVLVLNLCYLDFGGGLTSIILENGIAKSPTTVTPQNDDRVLVTFKMQAYNTAVLKALRCVTSRCVKGENNCRA